MPEGTAALRTPAETVVSIQYLRAVAAALVAFQHAAVLSIPVDHVTHFGTFGVDLFFVISGYIMWATTAPGGRGPLSFWLARIVRVVPLYWIFTVAYLAAAFVTPASFFNLKLDLVHIVKSFFFIPAEHPAIGIIVPVYAPGWTLNYEMFFYFLFGLCLFVPRRLPRFIALAAILLLLVAAGVLIRPTGPVARFYADPIMLEFLGGVVLAVLSRRLMRGGAALGLALLAFAALWVGVVHACGMVVERVVAHGIPAMIAVAGALMLETRARARPSRIGLLLGDASYSIYLAHPFAQRAWQIAVNKTVGLTALPLPVWIVTALLVSILGGVIVYRLIERPLLIAGRRLIGRAQPTR